MLQVHHSNRLERLADALCEALRVPAGGPLEPEVIVVPNAGMARWVSLAVAERLGIAANLDCPFPAAFVARALHAHWPELPPGGPFEREALALRVLAALPELSGARAFAPVRRYLAAPGAPPGLRAWQFARRMAECFERYALYRPDWCAAWEAGDETHWQARLWRHLAGAGPGAAPAVLGRALRDYLTLPPGAARSDGLPVRLAVFGVAALPPPYLALLESLAVTREVAIYFPNPSAAYWGDVVSARTQALRRARRPGAASYDEEGHPLLASLGSQGRDFLDLLTESTGDHHEHYTAPDETTLLGRLQADILALRAPGSAPLADGDESITLHACHAPLREVQVLHDRLLALFEARPGLEPRDVVVMAPDIEAYAPHVAAVFGAAPAPRHIPWSLADRVPAAQQPLAAAFLSLLDLPESRLPASQVLALLDLPAVRAAFGLPGEALPVLRRWVAESGARFGYDARARGRFGLPATHEHTWRFGLDRLLLAHATRCCAVQEVAPLPELAAGAPEWAGALAELLRRLDALAADLAGPYPPQRWAELLAAAVTALFRPADEDEEDALDALRGALDIFSQLAAQAGYAAPLERAVVRAQLSAALDQPGAARAFLTGAVTCCALTPMRAVPFRVVCVLGLDHDAFPRRRLPPDFDLAAARRRRGDRVPREEDRYLFLEALLSARDLLHLSWVGHSVRDDSALPPSVVVGELADVLRAMAGEAVDKVLTVHHPLQPFSNRYGETPHRSYAAQWFVPARAPVPFTAAAAAMPAPAAVTDWTLAELTAVLCRPARRYLEVAVGVRLPRTEDEPVDEEPFIVSGLEAYALTAAAVAAGLDGRPAAAVESEARRTGLLPGGRAGALAFRAVWEEAQAFAEAVEPHLVEPQPPRVVNLALPGGARLHGRLDGLTRAGLVRYRCARARASDYLALWVAHLALCADRSDEVPGPVSVHVGREALLRLAPLAPEAALHALAELTALAARAAREALPFLPRASLAFAGARDEAAGMNAARREWQGDARYGPRGECNEAEIAYLFRGREPLAEPQFQPLAHAVYDPLLAAAGPDAQDETP